MYSSILGNSYTQMKLINRQGIEFLVHNDTNDEVAGFWNLDAWEQENYPVVQHFSSQCSTFINAGGWIGPFTLFAAKIFKRVYSLEPDPLAFEELTKNVELNKFTNVQLGNKALFDGSKKEITMGSDFSPLGRSGTSIFQLDKAVTVPCITLREYFDQNDIIPGSFLMLDVEGAEYALFDDVEFFEKYRPVIFIELHLKFLNDENYTRLINALNNLKHIYPIDTTTFDRNNISHKLFQPI